MSDNPHPVIVLVEPQLGANIGMCARAMLNCGWSRLRLVSPREGWPQDEARAAAADADEVLEAAECFDSVDEAIEDLRHVYATTARERSTGHRVVSAGEAAIDILSKGSGQSEVGILFGPEASGLDREAVARASTLVRFDTNPAFPSLNLSQAVLLLAWEWRRAVLEAGDGRDTAVVSGDESPARRAELDAFVGRLFEELDTCGYFLEERMAPHSRQSLRELFARARPTEREIAMLHGVVTALRRGEP